MANSGLTPLPRIIPFPTKVKQTLNRSIMYPIWPVPARNFSVKKRLSKYFFRESKNYYFLPPRNPFCGTKLHRPCIKKLVIPIDADNTEVPKVVKKKNSLPSVTTSGFWRKTHKSMWTWGTHSSRGSVNLMLYSSEIRDIIIFLLNKLIHT